MQVNGALGNRNVVVNVAREKNGTCCEDGNYDDYEDDQCNTWDNQALLHFDGLVEDYSNSSALATEILESCTKPSTFFILVDSIL